LSNRETETVSSSWTHTETPQEFAKFPGSWLSRYMIKSSAKIYVNKLAAAQRQLRGAIRNFFAREDELLIHSVASAAYGILKDLKTERGRNEVGDYYATMIFYAVREYRRGALPRYLADDPEAMKWIREIADQLPIDASTKYEDIATELSPDLAPKFWHKRNRISNFLKHARHDPKFHISLEEVDNLNLLAQALCSYIDLASDDLGAEGQVFRLYFCTVSGIKEVLPPRLQSIAAQLEELDSDDRLNLCSQILHKMKQTA
jgi:hypothetical protein